MTKELLVRSTKFFLGLLSSKALNLAVFIVIARILSPEEFGDIVLFTTLIALVTSIADAGLSQWIQKREWKADPASALSDMVSARLVTLLISAIVVGVYLLISQRFSFFVSMALLLSLLPEGLLSVFDGYHLATKQPLHISVKHLVKSGTLLLAAVTTATNFTLETFVYLSLFISLSNCTWFVPWKYLHPYRFALHKVPRTLQQSRNFALLIATSFVYSRGDALYIEHRLGSASLGLYSAAYRYLEGISLLPSALSQNLFHIAAKKDGVQPHEAAYITLGMGMLGIVIGFCLYYLSPTLIIGLLGSEYAPATEVLEVLSIVSVLLCINAPLATIVQSSNLLQKFLPWGIGNTVLNIVLNVLLVPLFGIVASAWVLLISEASGMLINIIFVRKLYQKVT